MQIYKSQEEEIQRIQREGKVAIKIEEEIDDLSKSGEFAEFVVGCVNR
jgi:hypothetical protein